MYRVQNLTNRKVIFQAVTIQPYGSITLPFITDFVSLSKFTNAGILNYQLLQAKKEVEQKVVPEKTVEAVLVEDVKQPEVIVDTNNETSETETDTAKEFLDDTTLSKNDSVVSNKKYGKRNKKTEVSND